MPLLSVTGCKPAHGVVPVRPPVTTSEPFNEHSVTALWIMTSYTSLQGRELEMFTLRPRGMVRVLKYPNSSMNTIVYKPQEKVQGCAKD